MVVNCCVKNCKNKVQKGAKKLKWFRFPKEKNLINKWMEFCGINKNNNLNNRKYIYIHKIT